MKHLKTKLVSAIAMLAVAAIMMTSATYAWFTISTAPEVSNVEANITANGNLEIALDGGFNTAPGATVLEDTGKNITWGNLVDLRSAFVNASNNAAITLKPVKFNYNNFDRITMQYANYGKDGRPDDLVNLTRVQAQKISDNTNEDDKFEDVPGVWFYTTDASFDFEKSANIYAFEIDFWLRTNASESHISLSADGLNRASGMPAGAGSTVTDSSATIIVATDGKVYKAVPTWSSSISKYTLALAELDNDMKIKASGATSIELTANVAKAVKIFVFLDGTTMTNANAKLSVADFVMNLQFQSDANLQNMVVTPKDINDKVTPASGS